MTSHIAHGFAVLRAARVSLLHGHEGAKEVPSWPSLFPPEVHDRTKGLLQKRLAVLLPDLAWEACGVLASRFLELLGEALHTRSLSALERVYEYLETSGVSCKVWTSEHEQRVGSSSPSPTVSFWNGTLGQQLAHEWRQHVGPHMITPAWWILFIAATMVRFPYSQEVLDDVQGDDTALVKLMQQKEEQSPMHRCLSWWIVHTYSAFYAASARDSVLCFFPGGLTVFGVFWYVELPVLLALKRSGAISSIMIYSGSTITTFSDVVAQSVDLHCATLHVRWSEYVEKAASSRHLLLPRGVASDVLRKQLLRSGGTRFPLYRLCHALNGMVTVHHRSVCWFHEGRPRVLLLSATTRARLRALSVLLFSLGCEMHHAQSAAATENALFVDGSKRATWQHGYWCCNANHWRNSSAICENAQHRESWEAADRKGSANTKKRNGK